jgi:membrane protein required for colicin V production
MSLFDIGILLILALFGLRGFARGIIQEAATLLGVIVGFFLAALYYGDLANFLNYYFPGYSLLLAFFSFVFLFGLSLFLFHYLAILARVMIRISLFSWADKGFGAVFGLVKGMILIFLLVSLITFFMPKTKSLVEHSRLYPLVYGINQKIALLIPVKVQEDYAAKKRELKEYWEGKERAIKKLQRFPAPEKMR